MLGLPESTEYNKLIPRSKLFARAVTASTLREVYEEQISRVMWRNKLSAATWPAYHALATDSELEVFEIDTRTRTLDQRLLRKIDQRIPYYILHVVKQDQLCQAWIADKAPAKRSIQVKSYYRTGWLNESELKLDFIGNTPKATVSNLIQQVESIRKPVTKQQLAQCSELMMYFRKTPMTRSYKPVLVMATIQSGGAITLEKAAIQFITFYQGRAERELPIEKSYCVYGDKEAPISKVYANLIRMPIQALCNSGYFVYDQENRIFSFADGIYDNLTLREIDEITSICKMRLEEYFGKLR